MSESKGRRWWRHRRPRLCPIRSQEIDTPARLNVDMRDEIAQYSGVATPTITDADIAAPLALDATIAALTDAPAPVSPFNWTALTAATGCTRAMYFANFVALRAQLDIDAAAALFARSCGYIATRKSTRAARHASYSNGTRTPPARETADDRARAEAVAWGLAS